MSKEKPTVPLINYKLHLILFFVTASLWTPFYNLICFLRLNKLVKLSQVDEDPSLKNSTIGNFFLALSVIGAPFAFYNRFKILRKYIGAKGDFRDPPVKKKDKEDADESLPQNCTTPAKFVGFAISTLLLIGLTATAITLPLLNILEVSGWANDKILILLPLFVGGFFTTFAFSVRTANEEKYWVKSFNAIAEEINNKN